MPDIRDSITGFNNEVCKIIHVQYVRVMLMTDAVKGNKAFFYAAEAAEYEDFVSYKARPGCETDYQHGSILKVKNMISAINKYHPRNPQRQMDNFARYFGVYWYFCKRTPINMPNIDDMPDIPAPDFYNNLPDPDIDNLPDLPLV